MRVVELFGLQEGEDIKHVLVDWEYRRGRQRWSTLVGPVHPVEARKWLEDNGFEQSTASGWERKEPLWIHIGSGLIPIRGAYIQEISVPWDLDIDEPMSVAAS